MCINHAKTMHVARGVSEVVPHGIDILAEVGVCYDVSGQSCGLHVDATGNSVPYFENLTLGVSAEVELIVAVSLSAATYAVAVQLAQQLGELGLLVHQHM